MIIKTAKKRPQRRNRAATNDVIGRPADQVDIAPKWQRHYDRLADLHAQMLRRKDDLLKDAAEQKPSYGLHLADAGTDVYDQEFALSMISSDQDVLYEIEEAMARIRLGTYGTCQLTGTSIEPERLNAIPWTRFSAEAETQLEREGAVAHPRLSPTQPVPRTDVAEEGEERSG